MTKPGGRCRVVLVLFLALWVPACGSGGDSTASCDDAYAVGQTAPDTDELCREDGVDTAVGWASYDCDDGSTLYMTDYGHWFSDDSVIVATKEDPTYDDPPYSECFTDGR